MNYRLRVSCVYLLGFFIDLINMFIANIAYPEIGHDFNASVDQIAWISTSYILGLTLVIPLSSWLGKLIGTKRIFLLSLFIFILSTCAVAASSSVFEIIIWRFLQGIGGGLLIPIGQTMTYALYQNHERAKLSSAVMLVALLAPALSPVVGGILIENLNWRWVFLASLPLAVLTFILASYWLKPSKRTESLQPLDLSGLMMGCSALTLILLGLTHLGESHQLPQGIMMLSLGILIMASYIWNALRKENPLINLHLVKNSLFQVAMIIYQFIPGIFTGVSMLTMFYLQNQINMRASLVGAMMLPWALASFVAISITGEKFNIWGPRPLFLIGCLVHALGIGLLAFTSDQTNIIIFVCAFGLMGFGSSLCSSTAQSAAFIQIVQSKLDDASALWNINRQLSFCLGVTLMSLLFNLVSNMNTSIEQAYHLCFLLAAFSAVIPILFCLRIKNHNVISILNQELK